MFARPKKEARVARLEAVQESCREEGLSFCLGRTLLPEPDVDNGRAPGIILRAPETPRGSCDLTRGVAPGSPG